MLTRWLPGAEYAVWLPSENPDSPEGAGPGDYLAVLWTGSNLNVYHRDIPAVARQIEFAERTYEAGTPAFGSCWGLQVAVTAAGGEVQLNSRGREIGFARGIQLTHEGRNHPMLEGKPSVFDNFSSHLDEVTKLPPGAVVLAGNEYSQVQAVEIRHEKGTFWGVQYHPEFDLHEMGRLIAARERSLVREGFFRDAGDLARYVEQLESLDREPGRKDLRWQLAVDDELISADRRQLEFRNWIDKIVLPRAAGA
jgi:GMP synthase (glutamine-hydrolysing)